MYQIKSDGQTKSPPPYPDYVLKGKTKKTEDDPVQFIKITDLSPPDPERLEELRKQVLYLKSLPQPVQRSPEWFSMREKMITASVWGSVLKMNKYSHRNAVVMQKCGHPGYQFKGNIHTEWGKKYEEAAIKVYEKRNNTVVWEFGVIPHPAFEFLGASPDGITPDGIMVEIKCPPRRTITGEVPEHYWCQIQGQLEVCKLDRCDFLECKLEEYENNEDPGYCDAFFEDNYEGDYSLASNGMEKGVVLNFMNKNTTELCYIHGNLGMTPEQYLDWKVKIMDEKKEENPDLIYVDTSFWKLMRVSCVPVFRDVKWFYHSLPRLRRCWEDITYFREVGLDKLVKKKQEKKITSTQISIDNYIDTESDDESSISTNNVNDYNDFNKFKGLNFFSENKLPPHVMDDSEDSLSCVSPLESPIIKKKMGSMFSSESKTVKMKVKKSGSSLFSSKPKKKEVEKNKLSFFAQKQLEKKNKEMDAIEAIENTQEMVEEIVKNTKKCCKTKKCPSQKEIKKIMLEVREIQSMLLNITEKLQEHISE